MKLERQLPETDPGNMILHKGSSKRLGFFVASRYPKFLNIQKFCTRLISPSLIFPQDFQPPEYIFMDAKSISKTLEGRKTGAFFSIKMKRPAKLLAAFKSMVIEKESTMTGQLCDYSARAAVKNAVANGERLAPELPSHIKESFMEGNVKFWLGNNGKVYLPMPLSGAKPKVQWYLDGEPCDKADVEMYLLASEKAKPQDKEELAENGQVPFVGISVENILEVH